MPDAGVAESETLVPEGYDWLQSVPQLMPPGDELTVLLVAPMPVLLTDSVYVAGL